MSGSGYQAVAEGLGWDTHLWADERDYQGDSWAIITSGDYNKTYGFLCFGWGSCSGCDALEDAQSDDEPERSQKMAAVATSLAGKVHWEESQEDLWRWLAEKDFSTEFYDDKEEFKTFLCDALELLKTTTMR